MPEYKEHEEVLMSLERYENMKTEIKSYEERLEEMEQCFFTVTEEADHVKVCVHLDELEKWLKREKEIRRAVDHVYDPYPNKEVKVIYTGMEMGVPKL